MNLAADAAEQATQATEDIAGHVVQAATEPTGIAAALLIVAAAIARYWWSLKRHPWTACRRCQGRSINRDRMFSRTFGDCRACGGTGRRIRLGVRLLQPNRKP